MDKEEILQKVGNICETHKYNLDDSFRDKFSDKFVENYNGVELDADSADKILGITLQTAYAAKSQSLANAQKSYEAKEAELKTEIEKLKGLSNLSKDDEIKPALPKETQDTLNELVTFYKKEQEKNRKTEVIELATEGMTEEQTRGFISFIKKQNLDYSKDPKDLAKSLSNDYLSFVSEFIGDTKPLGSSGNDNSKFGDLYKQQQERIKKR